MLQSAGKYFMLCGVVIFLAGIVLLLAGRYGWTWRLPGDIVIKKEGFTVYFPIATCLVVSAVISLLLYLFSRR